MFLSDNRKLRLGWRLLSLFIAVPVIGSCTIDRKPVTATSATKPHPNDKEPGVSVTAISTDGAAQDGLTGEAVMDGALAESSADGGDVLEVSKDASPDRTEVVIPKQKFGRACGKVTCPAVRVDAEQCCTSVEDVTAKRALEADKCGVDLSGRGGPRCIELEQQGLVDPKCAAATPAGALSKELGCCSAEGFCGTFNAQDGIGCHYNKTPGKKCSTIDDVVSCERTGVFAVRTDVPVSWDTIEQSMIRAAECGRDKIPILMLATIEKVNASGEFASEIKVCHTKLPPTYSQILCEAFQPDFSASIKNSEINQHNIVTGRYQCANPGCFLTFDPFTFTHGIMLDDPNGPWPTPQEATSIRCELGRGAQCYPDLDKDGSPGVTAVMLTEGKPPQGPGCPDAYSYDAPPLSTSLTVVINGVRRADRLHLGIRMRTGGSSLLNEKCGFEQGIGVADFVQSRAIGCMVQEGTYNLGMELFPVRGDVPCNQQETDAINQFLPTYEVLAAGEIPPQSDLPDKSPSEGSTFQTVRLGNASDKFSCEDVRKLMLPEASTRK